MLSAKSLGTNQGYQMNAVEWNIGYIICLQNVAEWRSKVPEDGITQT